jgi:Flp pilus assembly protein TadD
MPDQIKLIDMRARWRRALLLAPVILILVGAWFGARWGFSSTLAESPPNLEVAQFAARLAPDDPQAHYTLAVLRRRSLLPEELPEALRQYEEAARLSPNDYRLWMELGRVRGQTGDFTGGEQALRRAVELAPSYSLPHWYLGNLLLRAGRTDDAFAELRRAADAHPWELRPQVFNLAWRVYDADVPAVAAAVGNSATVRAELTTYLLKQKRLDDARHMWLSLSQAEKREQRPAGEALLRTLVEARRFHEALEVEREIAPEGATPGPEIGRLLNGGFDEEVAAPGKSFWGWQIAPGPQLQPGLDPRLRHGGARSLRLVFNAYSMPSITNVSQLIAVAPGSRYRLQYHVRAEDLKSVSMLITEVVDTGMEPGRMLATAGPLANGTSDWQAVTLDFNVPAQSEAITVRLNRAPCPYQACPLFGKVWYDDFDLQRVGGAQ